MSSATGSENRAMPLFNLANKKQPRVHPQTWKDLRAALSDARIRMIKRKIDRWVSDQLAKGIETPFVDSTRRFIDTNLPQKPFDVIYYRAARSNQNMAAKMFGLFIWEVMRARREKWVFSRPDRDPPSRLNPVGMAYFRPFNLGEKIKVELPSGQIITDVLDARPPHYLHLRKHGLVPDSLRYWHGR